MQMDAVVIASIGVVVGSVIVFGFLIYKMIKLMNTTKSED